jgi:hypothetical protein
MTVGEFKRMISEIPDYLDNSEIGVMDFNSGLKIGFGECPQLFIEKGQLFIPGFATNSDRK